MSEISLLDEWDRTFLDLSSKCAEPICWTYGLLRYKLVMTLDPDKFDNATSKVKEIGKRILIAVGALIAFTVGIEFTLPALLGLGVASRIFRAIGFSLQKKGFTHIRTSAPEKRIDGLPKVATWNVLGVAGGMHYDHGGVVGFRARLQGILEKIRNEDPDVLVLQEIYDTALAEALIRELGKEYAHIYAHLGKSVMGSVGGLMVFSKCAVHRFDNEDFHTSSWTLKRGFATIEVKARPEDRLPCARIIGTHLIHGHTEQDKQKRVAQVAQIVNSLAKRTLALPTVLVGDANIERDSKEAEVLNRYLKPGYVGSRPTCTNRLVAKWNRSAPFAPEEKIDIISSFKRVVLDDGRILPVIEEGFELKNVRLIEAFDDRFDTKTALSDHHMLVAELVQV